METYGFEFQPESDYPQIKGYILSLDTEPVQPQRQRRGVQVCQYTNIH